MLLVGLGGLGCQVVLVSFSFVRWGLGRRVVGCYVDLRGFLLDSACGLV